MVAEQRQPVLALDLGSATGWACGVPGTKPVMGAVKLGIAGNYGSIGGALHTWLWDAIDIHKPGYIVFEAPLPSHRGIAAGRIALGLAMMVETVGYQAEIMTRECAVKTVRKRIIGTGNADKEDVMAWCQAQGWKPPTHDAADAAALWELACRVRLGKARFDDK